MESTTPKISVVVPVYNMGQYVAEALDSVLAQTLKEFEVICVDDGSTDSSPKILAEYSARDSRIRVITQENQGISVAHNVAMRVARGEFIAFLDPDDSLPDSKVYDDLYHVAKKEHVKVCGGWLYTSMNGVVSKEKGEEDGILPQDGLHHFSEWQYDHYYCRYIFDRKMLVENGIFFPEYVRFADPVFCARALEVAGLCFGLNRPSYLYRIGHHKTNYLKPRVSLDYLRGLRDQLKFSKEHGYAKLHWLTLVRIFWKYKASILPCLRTFPEYRGGCEFAPLDESNSRPWIREFSSVLQEIEDLIDIPLAREYKADTPNFSVSKYFRRRKAPAFLVRLVAGFIPSKTKRKDFRIKYFA